MDKYRNKYRIPSARLQNWDYGSNGAYFITICTAHRQLFFGEIENGVMLLNDAGKLAEKFWLEIPQRYPFIELGNYVVMPNHTHGILIIEKELNVETRFNASQPTTTTKPPQRGGITGDKNPMLHENISRILNWYKGRCTFEIRQMNAGFGWQSRFHDHIIRSAASFERIQTYIETNPENWQNDKFYPK
ncbi:transposase [Sphingobacteriales bacterium UPWRP_1]|nr:hypothetical protein B6N25_12315 [Sphingobacteriales bacterium TSM_CSS]PSJ74117.1 transposase [Sphingobacteriales bacterium UPWRP_1]